MVGNTSGGRCLGFTHMLRSKIRKEEKKMKEEKHVDGEMKGNEREKWPLTHFPIKMSCFCVWRFGTNL